MTMLNSPSHGPRRVPPPYSGHGPLDQISGSIGNNNGSSPQPSLGLNLGRSHQQQPIGQSPLGFNNGQTRQGSGNISNIGHGQNNPLDQQRLFDGMSMFHSPSPQHHTSVGNGGGGLGSVNSSVNMSSAIEMPPTIAVANGGSPALVKESKTSHRSGRDGRGGHVTDEVVEVQILPQDDNWADNTTCITGATSERSLSAEDISRLGTDRRGLSGIFLIHMWLGSIVAAFLSIAAFLSPLGMVLLPKLPFWEQPWKVQACGPECDGLLNGFAFRLCILFGGCWAVFFRRPRATLPRVFVFRAVIMAFTLVVIISYWLFYSVRIYERRYEDFDLTYLSIVQFALSMIDTLLWVQLLAVLVLEIRHLPPQYYVKVVRSPDGASKSYTLGAISIQRAAVHLLENYYRDFPVYNPFLEQLPSSTSAKKHNSQPSFKVYDLNSGASQTSQVNGQSGGRRTTDRLFAEHDYEKRVKKRRARLITAVEDAFTHIKRVKENQENTGAGGFLMDPQEAAQAVFPSMARALQKFLRITRQQPRHTMQGILEHLATCLHYDLSPKAFLEKYLKYEPVLQDERELATSIQSWALVCDVLLSRPVKEGITFILRQGDVSLMASVHNLPHFNITEEVVDPKCNKFQLRLQSETSV
ncbi:vang-like protein 2 [Varroa jacobsoni]|uniref:Vang-like protein n=1 Tax=Varroa destructor TaxID=109461 RepID=A0A7M7KN34_VARDE|nr:vang-like protein 2 [Varroa destructor]XP_022708224.1 vang-like protein 2 [Varroa jacobsoni]